METLVVVAHHKTHYYDRTRVQAPGQFGSFGSPPYVGFKEINCRTFESGQGLLPTPLRSCSTPITKKGCSPSSSSSSIPVNCHSEGLKKLKKSTPSSAISIPINIKNGANSIKVEYLNDEFAYSELWAGPAYSNSPPPSSLPIPKFTFKPKRTVSLELHGSPSDIDLPMLAKSAPASPTRDRSPSPGDPYFFAIQSQKPLLYRVLSTSYSLQIHDAWIGWSLLSGCSTCFSAKSFILPLEIVDHTWLLTRTLFEEDR
ncbi:hypothetical protein K7X08_011125 [Anisodus acutangulus]|uniref:Uncharacterized protein n=1 Tax=Anisodus acutangulus TaxID=402998 RepID=A0A9Q1M0Y0_9SOLA|nr:hypothetical protein K7X08_011125 [Anisodus acutangulus]